MSTPLRATPFDVRALGRRALVLSLWILTTLPVLGRAAHAQSASAPPSVDPAFAAALWMSSQAIAGSPDALAKQALPLEVKRGPRTLAAGLGMVTAAAIALAMFGRTVDPCDYDEPKVPKATLTVGGVAMAFGALMTAVGAYRISQQTAGQRAVLRGSPDERTKSGLIGSLTGVLTLGVVGGVGFLETFCVGT